MKKMLLLVVLSTIFVCVSCSCDKSADVLFPNDGGKTIAEFGGVKLSDKYIKNYVDHLNDYLKSRYNTPERVKASHILIKTNENRDKEAAKKLAEQVAAEARKSAKDMGSFAKLAEKYSEDEGSKKRGGDLGYFERTEEGGKMVKEFSDGAFALKEVGDISDPVESEFGFHVIKLTGRKERVEKTFEDVKNSVENTLKTEKRKTGFEDAVEKIKKELGYKFDKDAAMALEFSVSEKAKDASEAFDKNQQVRAKQLQKPILTKEQIEMFKKKQQEKNDSNIKIQLNQQGDKKE